jgi:hypothetical protein
MRKYRVFKAVTIFYIVLAFIFATCIDANSWFVLSVLSCMVCAYICNRLANNTLSIIRDDASMDRPE